MAIGFLERCWLAMVVLIAQAMFLPKLPSRSKAAVNDIIALLRIPRALIDLVATALVAGGHFTAYTYPEPFCRRSRACRPVR